MRSALHNHQARSWDCICRSTSAFAASAFEHINFTSNSQALLGHELALRNGELYFSCLLSSFLLLLALIYPSSTAARGPPFLRFPRVARHGGTRIIIRGVPSVVQSITFLGSSSTERQNRSSGHQRCYSAAVIRLLYKYSAMYREAEPRGRFGLYKYSACTNSTERQNRSSAYVRGRCSDSALVQILRDTVARLSKTFI